MTMTDTTMVQGLGVVLAVAATIAPTTQRYRLIEVAGTALPAEVEKSWNCREYVTRGDLTLGSDSLWSLRVTLREVCGERAEVETETEHGRYSVAGDTVRFFDDDDDDDRDTGDDVDLDDLKSGTLAADGSLTVRLEDDRSTLVFRK
jgi:hypothetical protein